MVDGACKISSINQSIKHHLEEIMCQLELDVTCMADAPRHDLEFRSRQ